LKEGDELELRVPELRRALTAANHSATHLLHWALREILGDHVKQAGSLVNDEMLRFDFTHFQATTPEEITRIENMVNEKILAAAPVGAKVMKKDDAISAGALALFGEKYGEEVRVLKIGDFSTELCGGTHVHNSSEIRLFKIVSEGGVAAGTRRIIALTSQAAFDYLNGKALALEEIRHILKAQSDSAAKEKILKLVAKLELAERAIEEANSKNLANEAKALTLKARELGGIRLLSHHLKGDMAKARALAEHIRQAMPSGVIAIGAEDDGKAILVVQVSKDLVSRVNAGKIIQEIAPLVGGRGGGKPDAAQAGGNNPAGLTEALAAVEALLPRS
jgi:alanyl-tRNA synthetase